ncbi:hypothetical protein [Sagittula salina]|uniref:Uncharacterized protein n=1 Tax=Sagittula salina TaxID=2820268 RepID=A0A940S3I7_9RHOB|nr:hypothetical protein [Sagittula salina]MBP0485121.1 hypothetical protein [Sagittula salina]
MYHNRPHVEDIRAMKKRGDCHSEGTAASEFHREPKPAGSALHHRRLAVLKLDGVAELAKKVVSFDAESLAQIAVIAQAMNCDEGDAFVRADMRLGGDPKMRRVGVRHPKRGLDPSQMFGAGVLWVHA